MTKQQVQLLQQERDEAIRTITSLATMLGWMNVPPRDTLEADVRALKARVATLARLQSGGYVQHLANCHLRTCRYPITYAAYCKRNDGHVCTCGLAVLTEEQP